MDWSNAYEVAEDMGAQYVCINRTHPMHRDLLLQLTGDEYQTVRKSADDLTLAVVENYQAWSGDAPEAQRNAEVQSSILFDTVDHQGEILIPRHRSAMLVPGDAA